MEEVFGQKLKIEDFPCRKNWESAFLVMGRAEVKIDVMNKVSVNKIIHNLQKPPRRVGGFEAKHAEKGGGFIPGGNWAFPKGTYESSTK